MKFGIRKPSFRKRVASRTSFKRVVRYSLAVKAPRGYGWLTNPKRAADNRDTTGRPWASVAAARSLSSLGGVLSFLVWCIAGVVR